MSPRIWLGSLVLGLIARAGGIPDWVTIGTFALIGVAAAVGFFRQTFASIRSNEAAARLSLINELKEQRDLERQKAVDLKTKLEEAQRDSAEIRARFSELVAITKGDTLGPAMLDALNDAVAKAVSRATSHVPEALEKRLRGMLKDEVRGVVKDLIRDQGGFEERGPE